MTLMQHPLLSEERPGILRFGGARMTLLDVETSFWGLRRQLEALAGRRLADAVLPQGNATRPSISSIRDLRLWRFSGTM